MLDAGGGGGGTPWESMTVQAMQTLIQNPDTDKHWSLVDGWKKSADLINEHRSQVQNYRDNLAAAWPPERNAAAAAYLARLDGLIASLTETYEAALANHDAFSTATLSLSLAQTDMQKIFDEYQGNEQLLVDFNAKQQEKQTSGVPQPSPGPSGEQPPVAPGRQEELRQKAVTLLHGVSTELAQAQVRLVTPRPYVQFNKIKDPNGPDDGETLTPPAIPPIMATPALESGAGGRPSGQAAPFAISPSGSSVAPPPAQLGTQQPGLVLGGTNFSTGPTNPGVSPITTTPGPNATGPISGPSLLPPTTGIVSPPREGISPSPLTPGRGLHGAIPPEGVIRAGGNPPGGIHAMPPGGIIGGPPGAGFSQPGAARPGTRRVNPVGGIIGENPHSPASARPVGATAASNGNYPASGLLGSTGKATTSKEGRSDIDRWDPDNPWETAEGVSPVVMPPREQRIDPGPAIGLR